MPKLTNIARNMHTFTYFREGADRPAGHNRRIKHRRTALGEMEIVKTLHGHEVAGLVRTYTGYVLWLDNCGYRTPTTSAAIEEFLSQLNFYPRINASAKKVGMYIDGHAMWFDYETDIHITLTEDLKPVLKLENFELKDNKLTYTVFGHHIGKLTMIGGYVYGSYCPEAARQLTKGYCLIPSWEHQKWVLRARKPEARETRLMALVLKGEASVHGWEE